jgi:hypothetical protein
LERKKKKYNPKIALLKLERKEEKYNLKFPLLKILLISQLQKES